MIRVLVSLLTLLSWLRPAPAQEFLVPIGGWLEGPANACALHGDTMLVGTGPRLEAHNLVDPAHPVLLGQMDLPFAPTQLAWRGGRWAAVAGVSNLFAMIDLQDVAAPSLTGLLDLGGSCQGLAISGTWAYLSVVVSSTSAELRVLDVSNPAQPAQVFASSTFRTGRLLVQGQELFLSSLSMLKVYSLADPATPAWRCNIFGPINPNDAVAVSGNTLYTSYVIQDWGEGFQALDIHDLADPTQLGYLFHCGGRILGVSGTTLLVQCAADTLTLLDFQNLNAPEVSGVMPFPGSAQVSTQTGNLMVSVNDGDVVTTALSPWEPPLVASRLDYPASTTGVASNGRRAYTIQGPEIVTLDVENPQHVTVLGRLAVTQGPAYTLRLTLEGDTLIASLPQQTRVYLLDEQGLPQPLAELPGSYMSALDHGQLALAGGNAGLLVYDVSDWSHPWPLAAVPLGYAREVARWGDLAAVVSHAPGALYLVDLSDPDDPHLVGQRLFTQPMPEMALADSLAFVVLSTTNSLEQHLEWFDISGGEDPQLLGTMLLPESITGLWPSYPGFLAGVMGGRLELWEPDLAGVPTPIQTLSVVCGAQGLAVVGNRVYVPASTRGLLILRDVRLGDPDFVPVLTAHFLPNMLLRLNWTRHVAAGLFRVETAAGPAGPWEELASTPDTTLITRITGGRCFYRVTQIYQ
jgi:hypothetical protein